MLRGLDWLGKHLDLLAVLDQFRGDIHLPKTLIQSLEHPITSDLGELEFMQSKFILVQAPLEAVHC